MIVYELNLFDLICTLYALSMGAEELNPLMQSIPVLIAYKIIIWAAKAEIRAKYPDSTGGE